MTREPIYQSELDKHFTNQRKPSEQRSTPTRRRSGAPDRPANGRPIRRTTDRFTQPSGHKLTEWISQPGPSDGRQTPIRATKIFWDFGVSRMACRIHTRFNTSFGGARAPCECAVRKVSRHLLRQKVFHRNRVDTQGVAGHIVSPSGSSSRNPTMRKSGTEICAAKATRGR